MNLDKMYKDRGSNGVLQVEYENGATAAGLTPQGFRSDIVANGPIVAAAVVVGLWFNWDNGDQLVLHVPGVL